MVDFMWKTSDPRIRIYYMPSHFNKERFEAAQAQVNRIAWKYDLFHSSISDVLLCVLNLHSEVSMAACRGQRLILPKASKPFGETNKSSYHSKNIDYQTLTGRSVRIFKAAPEWHMIGYALEQSVSNNNINYFKNNNEAWAIIKRTGFPSVNGNIMKSEDFINSGVKLEMPRRFSIARPFVTNLNAQNINNAIMEIDERSRLQQSE
ncbi:hypothetical protein FQR65_LT16520 [Abscondita terminalis]|nr:hypothetical protein FQR65_LT16520 [Abscondita terminalis]